MYFIWIRRQRHGQKKPDNKNHAQKIEYLRCHLDLYTLLSLSDASGNFMIVMGRLFGEVIRSLVQSFTKAIIHGADNQQLVIATVYASRMRTNWQFAVHPKVSYSTVAGMSLFCRMIFFFEHCFKTEAALLLVGYWRTWMSFNVLTISLPVTTFRLSPQPLPTRYFISPGVWMAPQWVISIVIRLYCTHQIFRCECGTLFMFHCSIGCLFYECCHRRHKYVWGEQPPRHTSGSCIGIDELCYTSV